MPDLEDFQNKQKVKKVLNKYYIKSKIYYLIKQTIQSFKYNFYKLATYLTNTLKTIVTYKKKILYKYKYKIKNKR